MLSIDANVLRAVYDYSRDSGEHLDAIYDQALRDYLKKKGQPVGLQEAFAQSARQMPANDRAPTKRKVTKKRRQAGRQEKFSRSLLKDLNAGLTR